MTRKYYELAKFLHETYETKANDFDWKTQKKCRVPFDKLPEKNKSTMLAVAEQLYDYFEKRVEVHLG